MSLWNLGARVRPIRPASCAHCGLPAPAPCFREGGGAGGLAFCCRACRQVYDLVRELSGEKKEGPPARAD